MDCEINTGGRYYRELAVACMSLTESTVNLNYYYYYYYIITLMQGIYNYITETKHVSKVCSVAAVLYLQFVLHVMLFPMLNFSTFTLVLLQYVCSA